MARQKRGALKLRGRQKGRGTLFKGQKRQRGKKKKKIQRGGFAMLPLMLAGMLPAIGKLFGG